MRLDKLQGNNFINKMTGKNEHPISQISGFRPPNDNEHQIILKRAEKKYRKEEAASVMMTIISFIFIIMYVYMYFHSKSDNKMYILFVAGIFVIIAGINIYKLFGVDIATKKIIQNRSYRIRKVRIHHFMPGFGANIGRPEVKIQDENGDVYSYEFIINGKMKRAYSKNKSIEFCLIELNKEKSKYCLMLEDKKKEPDSTDQTEHDTSPIAADCTTNTDTYKEETSN